VPSPGQEALDAGALILSQERMAASLTLPFVAPKALFFLEPPFGPPNSFCYLGSGSKHCLLSFGWRKPYGSLDEMKNHWPTTFGLKRRVAALCTLRGLVLTLGIPLI